MPTRAESEERRLALGLGRCEARGPFEALGRAVDRIGSRIRSRRAKRKGKVTAAEVVATVADVVSEAPAVVASAKNAKKKK